MNNIQVSIRSLVKTYASGHETLRVLDDLNLDISSSSSTAICGKSGCGKSTLLNIIGGLDRPTSGSVKIDDWHLEDLSPARLNSFRSQYIGFVFQFHYLLKDFTALENIMLPAHIAGLSKKAAFEKAEKLIDEVKLSSRARHFPSQLSGGERQRVNNNKYLSNLGNWQHFRLSPTGELSNYIG
jgi:lipoprotein-releasing system ATP-binding protein